MAQQYTDRAYENCTVTGLADVTLQGAKTGYQAIPAGDSVCLIEGLTNNNLNGEWEVVRGVRTGSTFTRVTVIDSSNEGSKVTFTDNTEIALVADSETFERIISDIAGNTADIATNAWNIAGNTADIATAQSDILDKVDKTVNTLQTMVGELNLPQATLSSIDKILDDNTIMDVFIYDTSLDDDGGAWVDKANWQAWYHEDLNTYYRGATKSFPKVALIVTRVGRMTIYDATDPTCPMWMLFTQGFGLGARAVAKNGVIYAVNDSNQVSHEFNFINDTLFTRYSFSTANGLTHNNIAERNAYTNGSGDTNTIVDWAVNDIAVTSDGKGNNIVYVATDGGVSRIAPDGTISSWKDLSAGVDVCFKISITKDGKHVMWGVSTNDYGYYIQVAPTNTPLGDYRYSNDATGYFHASQAATAVWNENLLKLSHGGATANTLSFAKGAIGSSIKLSLVDWNHEQYGNSMTSAITTTFNSGWMHGDIKGAWLADTHTASLVGSELVTNGTFDTDTGWTKGDGWTISAGVASCDGTQVATTSLTNTTLLSLSIGETYVVSFEITAITAGSVGLSISATGVQEISNKSTTGVYSATFVANTSTPFIQALADSSFVGSIDNVSVRLTNVDRSPNYNGLAVRGTITRTPVATGAELVAYGGFSLGNTLKQSYNPDLDYTGDFYFASWIEPSTLNYAPIFDRDSVPSTVEIYIDTGLNLYPRLGITGGAAVISNKALVVGQWQFIEAFRIGKILYMSIDNEIVGKVTHGGVINCTNVNAVLCVGSRVSDVSFFTGSMALARTGATVPSAKQRKKIYESEKALFKQDAKCTLQGSSASIKALDFDDSTNILTVCSANHITKFNGLTVVEDRAEVATSVSTVCDKEITGV